MGWRSFLALVIVAAAVAGAASAAMTLLVRDDDGATARGLVHLGSPASLPNIDHEPFCVPPRHFCIVQPEPGRVAALYTYDPHPVFRRQGCEVQWQAEAEHQTGPLTSVRGLFVDPCGGSMYDMTGHRVFGPSPTDLDAFPVEVTADATIVDTRSLICGERQGVETHDCQRAPVGD